MVREVRVRVRVKVKHLRVKERGVRVLLVIL